MLWTQPPTLFLSSITLCLSLVNLDFAMWPSQCWMNALVLCTQSSLPPLCLFWHDSLMSGGQTLRNCFCPWRQPGKFYKLHTASQHHSRIYETWCKKKKKRVKKMKTWALNAMRFSRILITLIVFKSGIRMCVPEMTPGGGFHTVFLKQYQGNYGVVHVTSCLWVSALWGLKSFWRRLIKVIFNPTALVKHCPSN